LASAKDIAVYATIRVSELNEVLLDVRTNRNNAIALAFGLIAAKRYLLEVLRDISPSQ
jgi:hypothetical protein